MAFKSFQTWDVVNAVASGTLSVSEGDVVYAFCFVANATVTITNWDVMGSYWRGIGGSEQAGDDQGFMYARLVGVGDTAATLLTELDTGYSFGSNYSYVAVAYENHTYTSAVEQTSFTNDTKNDDVGTLSLSASSGSEPAEGIYFIFHGGTVFIDDGDAFVYSQPVTPPNGVTGLTLRLTWTVENDIPANPSVGSHLARSWMMRVYDIINTDIPATTFDTWDRPIFIRAGVNKYMPIAAWTTVAGETTAEAPGFIPWEIPLRMNAHVLPYDLRRGMASGR